MSGTHTFVHLVRHGEVDNPNGVLYGRLPGYHLSRRGEAMAARLGEFFADRDVAVVTASSLERAQESAAPVAAAHGLPVLVDDRLIEAGNHLEGMRIDGGRALLTHPRVWPRLCNPLTPSWGEPYERIADRMAAAADAARNAATGREAVLVTHQLPVETLRRDLEGRRLWHDPRARQCSLASVTTLMFLDDRLISIEYTEPALDLLPDADPVPGA